MRITVNDEVVLRRAMAQFGASLHLGGGVVLGLMARVLPTRRFRKDIELPAGSHEIMEASLQLFTEGGDVLLDESDSKAPRLSVLVSPRLNPTILHLEMAESNERTSTLQMTGVAKDGLVNRRSAERAVEDMAKALTEVCSR